MSKISNLLLIVFIILEQILFIPRAYAVEACSLSMEITSESNQHTARQILYFPENSPIITLNFRVTDDNVFNNKLTYIDSTTGTRTGKEVRLNFATGLFPGQTSLSVPATIKVDTRTFTLSLTDEALRKQGEHWGRLEFKDPGKDFEEFCTDVKYQVGANYNCEIDPQPTSIPTNTSLDIRFIGNADTNYQLSGNATGAIAVNIIARTKTRADGQGVFEKTLIPGSNGDTITLTASSPDLPVATACATSPIKISDRAPKPVTPTGPSGPVLPGSGAIRRTPAGPPAVAGGDTCTGGFKTAIGCVRTDPAAFVKDFLTFIIAISGGLAFLMMLLGAFQMLSSAGNPETLAAGKDRFTSAIIGLLFVIFAVLLMQIIGVDILRLPGFNR